MRIRPHFVQPEASNTVAKQRFILLYPPRKGYDPNCIPVQIINRSRRQGKYLFMASSEMIEETNSYFGLSYGLVNQGKINPMGAEIIVTNAFSNIRYKTEKYTQVANSVENIVFGEEVLYDKVNGYKPIYTPRPQYYNDEEQLALSGEEVHFFHLIRNNLRHAIVKVEDLVDSSTRFLFIKNTDDTQGILDENIGAFVGSTIGNVHVGMSRCFFRRMDLIMDSTKGYNILNVIPDHESIRKDPDIDEITHLFSMLEREFENFQEFAVETDQQIKLVLHLDEVGCSFTYKTHNHKESIGATKRIVVDKSYRLSI